MASLESLERTLTRLRRHDLEVLEHEPAKGLVAARSDRTGSDKLFQASEQATPRTQRLISPRKSTDEDLSAQKDFGVVAQSIPEDSSGWRLGEREGLRGVALALGSLNAAPFASLPQGGFATTSSTLRVTPAVMDLPLMLSP